MGAATAYHLARRGIDVIGFDQFDVPNMLGSSGGESRIIRMCYFEHPDYVPLLKRAYVLWHELAREAAKPVIEITGGLFIGSPASGLVAGSKRAADEHKLAHEMLSNDELQRRWPQFRVTSDMIALFEPTAGFVRPELAIAAHAELARKHGATLWANEPVVEWSVAKEGVVVTTAQRQVQAKSLLICAGPWTTKLASALAPRLRVTRQPLVWVSPPDASAAQFALHKFPVWAVEHPRKGSSANADFHYGFPIIDAAEGFKVGRHEPLDETDPDTVDRSPRPDDAASVRDFLQTYLPAASGPVRDTHICMYTNSPDGHFIIDRHPSHDNVFIATGFSGHGFKFATVIGEALADLAQHGKTKLPIGFLGLQRFGRGTQP